MLNGYFIFFFIILSKKALQRCINAPLHAKYIYRQEHLFSYFIYRQ